MSDIRRIATRAELVEAAGSADAPELIVANDIDELPTLRLAPGQSLRGVNDVELRFASGADGVQLRADSTVSDLDIVTDPERRAVFNDTDATAIARTEGVEVASTSRQAGSEERLRAASAPTDSSWTHARWPGGCAPDGKQAPTRCRS